MRIFSLLLAFSLSMFASVSKAQTATGDDFAGFIQGTKGAVGAAVSGNTTAGYLDTLVNTDTTVYIMNITGAKNVISFQVDVLKISGTVAGSIRLEGSVNGLTWETALVTSATTITDASANYVVKLTNNAYRKYRLTVVGSGTNNFSNRLYLMYRKQP